MKIALDWRLSAAQVLRLVRDDAHPVALLGAWGDVVAAAPTRTAAAGAGALGDVLDQALPPGGDSGFGGGWIGYLGFGATQPPDAARRLPGWWFGYYEHVLRRDPGGGPWYFESPHDGEAARRRLAELSRRAAAAPPPRAFRCGEFLLTPAAAGHQAAVRQAVDYIRRGDIFQANICLRLEAGFCGDPLDAFCQAAERLRPRYAAFLRVTGGAVASLSPELFLRRSGRTVLTSPIKGTARRTSDDAAAQRARLERSVKDRAENVMIVDLMRNDISRVCEPGSVRVPALLRAEEHPGVWHLVSDVTGELADGVSDGELIAATFPPGSVTGAPKIRAVEVIGELEATPREVYTGAIGYRSAAAGLELNVAIRTFEFAGSRVWLGAGGGITAWSDAAAEFDECLVKAAPLTAALDAAIGGSSPRPAVGTPPELSPRPALGVFTSLLTESGACRDLDAHLARLDDSTVAAYGKHLPPGTRAELGRLLAARPSGRLRITARPLGGPVRVSAEVVPAGPSPRSLALRPVTVPGGIGALKWADRRLLNWLGSDLDSGEQLLLVDADGDVLETDRGNVFAVVNGMLCTPPLDGRLLPGITRAAVLRAATVKAMALSVDMLMEASEVFVTNAVHGVVPVHAVGGRPVPLGPVTRRVRAKLAAREPVLAAWSDSAEVRIAPGLAPLRGKVLLIDNYDSFSYNLVHLLRGAGHAVVVVRNDEVSAADVAAAAPGGIVISPGPGTPDDAGISVEVVRRCGAAIPVLGICLGHQAIAVAYGGSVTAAPEPVHGRASRISHDGRGVLAGLPQGFTAARYHSLIAAEATLPACLAVTARDADGVPMGLRHARHPVEGVQFHPESILTAQGAAIIEGFLRIVRGRVRAPR